MESIKKMNVTAILLILNKVVLCYCVQLNHFNLNLKFQSCTQISESFNYSYSKTTILSTECPFGEI